MPLRGAAAPDPGKSLAAALRRGPLALRCRGIFLSAVGAAPLGLLIALAAAIPLGHRVILRTVGVLAIILTLLVLIVCGAFALDVLQVRSIVRPEVRGGFDVSAAKAVLMGLVVMVTSILIAIA